MTARLAFQPARSEVKQFVVIIGERQAVKPMDQRIEAFLADVLALEGEDENAIREGVRVALADCEQIFKAQEANRRMKDKAAHACHVLYRARVVEEIRRRKGTLTADHLKLVLSEAPTGSARYEPAPGNSTKMRELLTLS